MLFNHRNLSLNANQACVSCHLTTNHVEDNGGVFPPLLTDFTYDNLGIPVNPRVPQLAGPQSIDYGLGARMDILTASELPVDLPKWSDGNPETVPVVESEAGKFKVPTLRNLRRTAPYGHNGFFADLETITNFYNTRDVGTWPGPEVATNMNVDELGNLGLSAAEETAIVAFMKTLSD
ncbi:MAG: cytochrome-c peroxidase [Syntrophobacteraceae bacterium]|nr:cytochrome-c peroxidase [Syntrophobacteraceae bacterium]